VQREAPSREGASFSVSLLVRSYCSFSFTRPCAIHHRTLRGTFSRALDKKAEPMILLITLNAGAIYLLLALFSESSTAEQKQISIEISVLSLIGLLMLSFAAGPLFGIILALPLGGAWVLLSFHYIAKLPWKYALISAAALVGFDFLLLILVAICR